MENSNDNSDDDRYSHCRLKAKLRQTECLIWVATNSRLLAPHYNTPPDICSLGHRPEPISHKAESIGVDIPSYIECQ